MISEKTFANQFSNFWRETLPNLEPVTRSVNLGYSRISDPVRSRNAASRRDLISESGRRLFFKIWEKPGSERAILLEEALLEAAKYLSDGSVEGEYGEFYCDDSEDIEINRLADWLTRYFDRPASSPARIRIPQFKGHGLISSCSGDFEDDDCLIEMKYVSRNFRSHDIRQVIVYSALKYFEDGARFRELRLINPFLGIEFVTNVDELIYSASGVNSLQFFQRLSYAVSSGEISH
ncbi:hypothetical protein [Mesorhizobium shangrilense]|uniref:Uncharacterized protein n=1 Tax=Mesorhizobium shangrilense TaxID=460060 RepID=A0ABV2DJ09_9HYPH